MLILPLSNATIHFVNLLYVILLFKFFSETFAFQLLDFIHEHIEDVGDAVDEESKDKKLADYFFAFLEANEFPDPEIMIEHISPELLVKHSITLFVIVIKKMQEREWKWPFLSPIQSNFKNSWLFIYNETAVPHPISNTLWNTNKYKFSWTSNLYTSFLRHYYIILYNKIILNINKNS